MQGQGESARYNIAPEEVSGLDQFQAEVQKVKVQQNPQDLVNAKLKNIK